MNREEIIDFVHMGRARNLPGYTRKMAEADLDNYLVRRDGLRGKEKPEWVRAGSGEL